MTLLSKKEKLISDKKKILEAFLRWTPLCAVNYLWSTQEYEADDHIPNIPSESEYWNTHNQKYIIQAIVEGSPKPELKNIVYEAYGEYLDNLIYDSLLDLSNAAEDLSRECLQLNLASIYPNSKQLKKWNNTASRLCWRCIEIQKKRNYINDLWETHTREKYYRECELCGMRVIHKTLGADHYLTYSHLNKQCHLIREQKIFTYKVNYVLRGCDAIIPPEIEKLIFDFFGHIY